MLLSQTVAISLPMPAKYLVTLDRLHLRIYRYSQQPGQFTPSIQPLDAFDLPNRENFYGSDRQERRARFVDSRNRAAELLDDDPPPSQEEQEMRLVERLVERISYFLEKNPESTWNLAANPALRDQVMNMLPENLRLRLVQVISKDLVNVPPVELREHFALR